MKRELLEEERNEDEDEDEDKHWKRNQNDGSWEEVKIQKKNKDRKIDR